MKQTLLQLDVESWKNGSWVVREHSIGEDAPRTDFIVVSGDVQPEGVKDVFRIFRRRNIIEYKGPGDRLTLKTIRKVMPFRTQNRNCVRKSCVPQDTRSQKRTARPIRIPIFR